MHLNSGVRFDWTDPTARMTPIEREARVRENRLKALTAEINSLERRIATTHSEAMRQRYVITLANLNKKKEALLS
jgi:hypothetical protein